MDCYFVINIYYLFIIMYIIKFFIINKFRIIICDYKKIFEC